MSARIALAFRAKAALLAASPAFAEGSNGSWADAADYNGELLDMIGGASGLATQGNTWYKNADEINNLTGGSNPPEMIGETVKMLRLMRWNRLSSRPVFMAVGKSIRRRTW